MSFNINFTQETLYECVDPMIVMSRMMRDSLKKEDFVDTFDLFVDILDYLPKSWVPVPIRLGTRKTAIYIFHETNPMNYFYYDHVNFMVGEDKLSITAPNIYYSELEDLCGLQPSYKHFDDVRIEMFLTKDFFFDFFWNEGKSIRDYVGLFSAFYFNLSGCMEIYDHKKRTFTVDGVSIKCSKGSFSVAIGEFASLFSSEFKDTYKRILDKMKIHVYGEPEIKVVEEKDVIVEPVLTMIEGLYLNGLCLVKEVCSGCISIGAYFRDKLEEKEKYHWCYEDMDIFASSHGLAINFLLTYLLHKYHDKSTVMSITQLPDDTVRYEKSNDTTFVYGYKSKHVSAYGDYDALKHVGIFDEDVIEACYALDAYFKDNIIRYYLKLNGGNRSKFKILDDLRVMPDRLYSVYPMIYEFYNRVYWIDIYKLDYYAQWDLVWSAIDVGFRFIRIRGVDELLVCKEGDIDFKVIDKVALCPLTGKPLIDSVLGHMGRSYDRVAYTEYIRLYGVDPGSREMVYLRDIRPNKVLNDLVSFLTIGIDTDKLIYERYQKLLLDD